MAPKIDRRLNIVFRVDRPGGAVHVHSTPISRGVFEEYYKPIAKAFSEVYAEGLMAVGPRIAYLALKNAAEDMGLWENDHDRRRGPTIGVRQGLVGEMHRLTNVVVPRAEGGWVTKQLEDAVRAGDLDADDMAEVNNVLAFFTCASAIHTREVLPHILSGMSLWATQTTSLNVTDYASSLQTSTRDESSGATAEASSGTSSTT